MEGWGERETKREREREREREKERERERDTCLIVDAVNGVRFEDGRREAIENAACIVHERVCVYMCECSYAQFA